MFIQNYARMRRKYVWQIVKAYLAIFGSTVLCVLAFWITYRIAVLQIVDYNFDSFLGTQAPAWMKAAERGVMTLLALFFPALASIFCVSLWRGHIKQSAEIPYIPPVREQIEDLPADKVLLRGSDAPAVSQQAELLRATVFSSPVPKQELLRAVVSRSSEESSS